ncbi:ParM/StbA family protein [Vibrio chagasii]|nr:ParM/StbA family protein [Vibrio chagasii]
MLEKNDDSIIYIGIDDGNAQFKVSSKLINTTFPTHIERTNDRFVTLDPSLSLSNSGPSLCNFVSSVSGQSYTIGDVKDPIPRNTDFAFTEPSQVLLQHALNQFGDSLDKRKFILCTGMPLRQFFKVDGTINTENVHKKMKSMRDSFELTNGTNQSNSRKKNIISLLVQPEALAALRTYLFKRDGDGKLVLNEDYVGKTIAVADPGGKTTDIAVFVDGTIDMDRSTTVNIGFNNLVKKATNYLYDLGFSHATHEQARTLIDSGKVNVKGVEQDHSSWVNSARKKLAEDIFEQVKNTLSDGLDLDLILFIGGTINALEEEIRPLIEQYYGGGHNYEIPKNADRLNAIGLELFSEVWYQNATSKS